MSKPERKPICVYCGKPAKQTDGFPVCTPCCDPQVAAIIEYMEKEQPLRCPLCGAAPPELEVRYVEAPAAFEGYWHTGDVFRCSACGAEGEYE